MTSGGYVWHVDIKERQTRRRPVEDPYVTRIDDVQHAAPSSVVYERVTFAPVSTCTRLWVGDRALRAPALLLAGQTGVSIALTTKSGELRAYAPEDLHRLAQIRQWTTHVSGVEVRCASCRVKRISLSWFRWRTDNDYVGAEVHGYNTWRGVHGFGIGTGVSGYPDGLTHGEDAVRFLWRLLDGPAAHAPWEDVARLSER